MKGSAPVLVYYQATAVVSPVPLIPVGVFLHLNVVLITQLLRIDDYRWFIKE